MCIHIGNKAAILILMLVSGIASAATYTKTVGIPPAATVMSTGTPNMAANILEVGMKGVEYIPSASSESRALANISKGLSIPTSGIVSTLKSGLKANIPGLLVSGAIAGIIAGVDWAVKDGQIVKLPTGNGTTPAVYTPSGNDYGWSTQLGVFSSPDAAATAIVNYAYGNPSIKGTTCSYYGPETSLGATCKTTVERSQTAGGGTYDVSNGFTRSGSSCPAPYVYSTDIHSCTSTGVPTPLVESDYDVLDGFVQGKDGTWQRGLADEVCKTSSDYDSCIANMGAKPYVSGPLSVSSPEVTSSTTTTAPDGSTTEVSTKTKTDYSLGYPSSAPGTISVDPKTTSATTTTTRDPAGNITGTNTTTGETTTTQPGSGTEIADGTFTDTPFPKVDPFYTQKFPGGFKDVWNNNKAAFDASPFISFLHSFVPSFSGSCPSWAMSFDIMPYAHFGSRQFSSLCSIFAVVKVIMLVTAMWTCRAIIFGG